MSVISGKDGKVMIGATTLADITFWTLATASNNPAYASSATSGHKKRVAGVKDASGSIQGKLDVADPVTDDFDEGDAVTLLLYIDATRFYSVPAIIDSINFEVDIDTGEVIGWTADYSADGAWTKPTYS